MDVQKSFDDSLRRSTLPDVAIDMSELGLDALLKNEVLKQVPIVKIFIGFIQANVNVHDKLFLKKVISFLKDIGDITPADREKIINKIDSSKKYRLKVGEKLLYIIDACSDYESSERVAKLFKAFLQGRITYDEYLDSASIIARLSKKELDLFLESYNVYYMDDQAKELMHTGLVSSEIEEIAVDLNKIEQTDWDDPPESYEADVSGGEIAVVPTTAGKIVFEIFGIGKEARLEQMKQDTERRVAELKEKRTKEDQRKSRKSGNRPNGSGPTRGVES